MVNNTLITPFGKLFVYADETRLLKITLNQADNYLQTLDYDEQLTVETLEQLTEYFNHQRTSFTIRLSHRNQTVLQRETLQAIDDVEYGKNMTYKEVAQMTSSPLAIRAVATHIANNPYPIIVACHRIQHTQPNQISKYIWGAEIKSFLNSHESKSF